MTPTPEQVKEAAELAYRILNDEIPLQEGIDAITQALAARDEEIARLKAGVAEHGRAARALAESNGGTTSEDSRLRTCGQHPTLGDVTLHGSRACGRLLSIVDLYRCANCQTAFCRACIQRHFADETPEAREALRKAELAAEEDFYEADVPENGASE